jgi:pimeloyl-ACP methyl ester carboxylesterase
VIFLQHGLFDSADSFVYTPGLQSIGTYLASQGHDVWLGNSRGNKYSHTHTDAGISDRMYFNFSLDEMARHDLPAVVRYITELTKGKIVYVGHSLGTTQMFAALADTVVNDFLHSKIEVFIALAPIVYLVNFCPINK